MSAAQQLYSQWRQPGDISAILMIIGGDIVQTALAQATGTLFVPICFSFGWVSYAFVSLINIMGHGRLLPAPDYAVRVFNLSSGYVRENKHWVIGRIARDHEADVARKTFCKEGIRISIYKAQSNPNIYTRFTYDWIHLLGLLCMTAQFAVAAVPIILNRDWSVMLITGVGTTLALLHAALPQWTVEKLPNRQHSNYVFALTSGNGAKDIMIIRGNKNCLNLEELAASESPRNERPWDKFSGRIYDDDPPNIDPLPIRRRGTLLRRSPAWLKFPIGFCLTLANVVFQSIAWLALLVTLSGVKEHTWFVLLVGSIGMFQNGITAAVERNPEKRNLPIVLEKTIVRRKVMDGLMDLHLLLGGNKTRPLLEEFFPGKLRQDEEEWWDGDRESYEKQWRKEKHWRGLPQSMFGNPEPEKLHGVQPSHSVAKDLIPEETMSRHLTLDN